MKFAFRVDASLKIGTGHVMRCLTLADALSERGARSTFFCRPHPSHLMDLICERGHAVIPLSPPKDPLNLPAGPNHAAWLGTDWSTDVEQTRQALGNQKLDWLVVDHYALDSRWEQALRPNTRRIMVVDDLADRSHDCDLLLDQNLGRKVSDYDGLLGSKTIGLIGPAYALLRPEFTQWRAASLQRRVKPQLKNLLITAGGVDQANATGKVLSALSRLELSNDLRITVVIGRTSFVKTKVQAQAAAMPRPTRVLVGVSNMAQLMAESDICIGAAGSTSWERCCLGLPTIQFVVADNQQQINAALKLSDSVLTVQLERLKTELSEVFAELTRPDVMFRLSKNAACVCDGLGAKKITTVLEKITNEDHFALQ